MTCSSHQCTTSCSLWCITWVTTCELQWDAHDVLCCRLMHWACDAEMCWCCAADDKCCWVQMSCVCRLMLCADVVCRWVVCRCEIRVQWVVCSELCAVSCVQMWDVVLLCAVSCVLLQVAGCVQWVVCSELCADVRCCVLLCAVSCVQMWDVVLLCAVSCVLQVAGCVQWVVCSELCAVDLVQYQCTQLTVYFELAQANPSGWLVLLKLRFTTTLRVVVKK